MKHGVNIVISNKYGQVLILKRSSAESYLSGFWDLPGGKVENSESLFEAAQREVKEESGLDVELEQKYFYIFYCQDRDFDIYGFKARLISENIALSEEHTEFKWVESTECNKFEYTPSVEATLEQFFK